MALGLADSNICSYNFAHELDYSAVSLSIIGAAPVPNSMNGYFPRRPVKGINDAIDSRHDDTEFPTMLSAQCLVWACIASFAQSVQTLKNPLADLRVQPPQIRLGTRFKF